MASFEPKNKISKKLTATELHGSLHQQKKSYSFESRYIKNFAMDMNARDGEFVLKRFKFWSYAAYHMPNLNYKTL